MLTRSLIPALLAVAGAACSTAPDPTGGVDPPAPPTPDDPSPPGTPDPTKAQLDVLLTDAPLDVDEVWVDIASVEIEQAEVGWRTLVDTPQRFDLLTLQDDVTAALGGAALEPGAYGQLRLIVPTAQVVVDGVSEELRIASGAQTGIKIPLGATLEAGMVYTLVLDFDAARSIKETGQGYLMTPVILVESLTGTPVAPPAEPETPPEEPEAPGEPETPPEPEPEAPAEPETPLL